MQTHIDLFRKSEDKRKFATGEVIFEQGEQGNEMFAVVEGKVDIRIGDRTLETVEPVISPTVWTSIATGRSPEAHGITSFFGDARTGENGATATAFDGAGQTVAVDEGATSATGLNVAKLRAAKKILMANEVDIDHDPLYVALTAEQHDDMMNEIQAVSLDFNTKPVLVDGRITSFMGFNFIHSERLEADSNTYRRCPAWAKSGRDNIPPAGNRLL